MYAPILEDTVDGGRAFAEIGRMNQSDRNSTNLTSVPLLGMAVNAALASLKIVAGVSETRMPLLPTESNRLQISSRRLLFGVGFVFRSLLPTKNIPTLRQGGISGGNHCGTRIARSRRRDRNPKCA